MSMGTFLNTPQEERVQMPAALQPARYNSLPAPHAFMSCVVERTRRALPPSSSARALVCTPPCSHDIWQR
jgi:hypothetical protein